MFSPKQGDAARDDPVAADDNDGQPMDLGDDGEGEYVSDLFPRTWLNQFRGRSATSQFYEQLFNTIDDVYNNSCEPADARTFFGEAEDFAPFPNATTALLCVFFSVTKVTKGEMNLLLQLLRNNQFVASDVPKNVDSFYQYVAHVVADDGKQKVASSTPGFFPVTHVDVGVHQVPILHPVHTMRMCLALPTIAPYFQRKNYKTWNRGNFQVQCQVLQTLMRGSITRTRVCVLAWSTSRELVRRDGLERTAGCVLTLRAIGI